MSELKRIEEALLRTARRHRWLRAWKGAGQGALAGGLIWLTALAVYKLLPIPAPVVSVAAWVALGCFLAGFVYGIWHRPSLAQTAAWVDERRNLKERLSTALEISRETASGNWKELVVTDAARHAEDINPRELLPFHWPGVTRWALLVLALGAGLGFVPEYRTESFKRKAKETAQVREVGKKLAEVTRQNLEQRKPALVPTEQALETVAELGEHLTQAKLTRSDALRDLTSATEKLREQAHDLSENPALKRLEQAARESSGGTPSPGDLQKQMDALQKAMGQSAGDPDKLDDLQKKLQKLQQSAANLPDKDSAAGKAASKQLAEALSELARQAREAGVNLPDLENAIASLKDQKADVFLKDLEAAFQDLEKLKNMAKAMQQLQQQAAKLGKDLAEQLKKGQAEAAQATLQKMIDQLQAAHLSQEQLQKIMAEVSKAVDPASDYGKVAQFLKQAAQQMGQGQKPGAAQSLAAAKKELEKLRQQMADAQALQAALQAMDQAQMAIAMGKSWEQCQGAYCSKCGGVGCSACRGKGWRPGGKPGSGVGTWADDSAWNYQADQQPVENSGITRPDMDARGNTDRPDDLNPNLTATKVKGQMSPGGSMPSITLKGVSIKGTSNVKYEEAAATAQAEAQSALNQDKVPRPYLNAVRDYFDDLKK
jgi:predicted transcriptional regulator